MCFNKLVTPILFDNLGRPLDLKNTDHNLWNDKCDYQELDEITNLNTKNKNLVVLQLNIRSLLGKQNDLNRILENCTAKKVSQKLSY